MFTRLRLNSAFSSFATPRAFSTRSSVPPSTKRHLAGQILFGVGGATVLGGSLLYYRNTHAIVHADANGEQALDLRRHPISVSELMRSYAVYSMCSVPALVEWSPSILSFCFSIPVVRDITEAVVRATFFAQFVGADTAEDSIPLLARLRAENKGVLFAYSVEVDENEAAGKSGSLNKDLASVSGSDGASQPASVNGNEYGRGSQPIHKRIIDEMIHCIDVAADFEDHLGQQVAEGAHNARKTWVAVKLTALVPDAQSLANFSAYLVRSRPKPPEPIPFPGCPHPSDLNILATQNRMAAELSRQDLIALTELRDDLRKICTRAKERGVNIIVDAEHSWYQPAIDAYTLALMREFNKDSDSPSPASKSLIPIFGLKTFKSGASSQPLVYATHQAYLRRAQPYLHQSLKDAQAGGYSLGVKLVRGAYHPLEIAAHSARRRQVTSAAPAPSPGDSTEIESMSHGHSDLKSLSISPDALPPVWSAKDETDASYDACAHMLLDEIAQDLSASASASARTLSTAPPSVGVLFGTHNWRSCGLILEGLVKRGLAAIEGEGQLNEKKGVVKISAELAERVTIGQLYGMSDALTNSLVEGTVSPVPFVIKYVPYGSLKEVMPYLSRRAIENKSVLGGGAAAEERRRAGVLLRRRLFG